MPKKPKDSKAIDQRRDALLTALGKMPAKPQAQVRSPRPKPTRAGKP